MDKRGITRIILLVLHTIVLMAIMRTATQQLETLGLKYPQIPETLFRYIIYIIYTIIFIIIFKPKMQWLIGIPIISIIILAPNTTLVAYMVLAYIVGTLRTYLGNQKLTNISNLIKGTALTTVIYSTPVLIGYTSTIILQRMIKAPPPFTGDAEAIVGLLKPTLLYQVMLATMIIALIYRSLKGLIDLIIALKATDKFADAFLGAELYAESKTLVEFEGPQYNALEWGMSVLLTMLVAPLIYSPMRELLVIVLDSLGITLKGGLALVTALISTIIAWIPLKILASAITRTAPVSKLLLPIEKRRLLLTYILVAAIVVLLLLVTPTSQGIIIEALTGRPHGLPDPLSSSLHEPDTEYFQNIAKLLDLIVRLFWSG